MKAIFFVVFLFISTFSFAQVSIDSTKRVQFGFFLGGNYTQLQVSSSVNEQELLLENDAGFTLGILGEYQISSQLKSLSTMETTFQNAKITYVENSQLSRLNLNWVFLQLGTRLNWLPFPNAEFAPYLTMGPKVQFELSQSSNAGQIKPLYSLNMGVGLDKANKHFKVAPELLYSYGFSELNEIGVVPTMKMHTISLLLYFKG